MYQKIRLYFLRILFRISFTRAWAEKRLPKHAKGYSYYWKLDSSKNYREDMYRRQKDMDANPTFEEMRLAIQAYSPKSVLNVGCGYGRETKALSPYFDIEGCDIAEDLIEKARGDLQIFKFDIVEDHTDKNGMFFFVVR